MPASIPARTQFLAHFSPCKPRVLFEAFMKSSQEARGSGGVDWLYFIFLIMRWVELGAEGTRWHSPHHASLL